MEIESRTPGNTAIVLNLNTLAARAAARTA
jgi:hypothetical protein